jgi:hypothetical protein
VREGFLSATNRRLVLEDADPESLLEKMEAFRSEPATKWIGKEER